LCLRVRSIGEGAGLEVDGHGAGFRPARRGGTAPPMRQNGEAHYDADDDIRKSVAEGFRTIRERKAAGGPGWRGGRS
jgi:hypothetical protein